MTPEPLTKKQQKATRMVRRAANQLFQQLATKAYWDYMSAQRTDALTGKPKDYTEPETPEDHTEHRQILQEIGATCWDDSVELVLGAMNSHRGFTLEDDDNPNNQN